MPRPRSKNFSKNLEYRNDKAANTEIAHRLERAVGLMKSIYGNLNFRRLEENKPIYSFEETSLMGDGVLLRPAWRVPFQDLRQASYGTSLIGALHKIDVDMVSPFSVGRYTKKDSEGFGFEMDEEDEQSDEHDLETIKEAVNFFSLMGYKTPGWSKRDKMKSVLEMMVRDTLSIDTVAFHLIRNKFGKIIEVNYLDPATIFECGEEGFRQDESVSYVQVIENQVVCTFQAEEVVLRRKHFSSDIYRRNTGFSPTEACIMDLVGVINALKFNKDRFSSRNPPLGFFSVAADLTPDALADLELQFENLYSGNFNNYRFPFIGTSAGEIKWNSLNLPSDMLFSELIQWLVSLVISSHGVSQEELGFKLKAGQTLSEPNPDKAIKRSSMRRLKSHLSFFADVFNEIKEHEPKWNDYNFTFFGVDIEDQGEVLERNKKRASTYMTVDELRAEMDLPTLGESLKERYNLTDEEFKKFKLAGAYIDSQLYMQANGSSLDAMANPEPEEGPDMGEEETEEPEIG